MIIKYKGKKIVMIGREWYDYEIFLMLISFFIFWEVKVKIIVLIIKKFYLL